VRAAVHLLPEEALLLIEEQIVLRLAALEDVGLGARYPCGKLGQLPLRVGQPLGAKLEVGARTRDLPRLEALPVLGADEEIEHGGRAARAGLRARSGLAHCGGPPALRSASSPVASRPQRVTSRTRSLDCTSRRMSTRAISWKKRAASRGLASMNSLMLTRSRARSDVSMSAWMV